MCVRGMPSMASVACLWAGLAGVREGTPIVPNTDGVFGGSSRQVEVQLLQVKIRE